MATLSNIGVVLPLGYLYNHIELTLCKFLIVSELTSQKLIRFCFFDSYSKYSPEELPENVRESIFRLNFVLKMKEKRKIGMYRVYKIFLLSTRFNCIFFALRWGVSARFSPQRGSSIVWSRTESIHWHPYYEVMK